MAPNLLPVRWSAEAPIHGTEGKSSRITRCGLDFGSLTFDFVEGPITCEKCLGNTPPPRGPRHG